MGSGGGRIERDRSRQGNIKGLRVRGISKMCDKHGLRSGVAGDSGNGDGLIAETKLIERGC